MFLKVAPGRMVRYKTQPAERGIAGGGVNRERRSWYSAFTGW